MISIQDMEKLRLGLSNRCHPQVRGIEFEFRPLTIAEVNQVMSQSIQKFEKMLPAEKNSIKESTLISVLTLTKASSMPGADGKIVPGVTEDTLMLLTADELGYLMREYNTMQEQCNPVLETIPEADLQKIADEIKKKALQPTELSSLQLMNLVRYLLTKVPAPTDS